jgi:NADPH2:quinone reductase
MKMKAFVLTAFSDAPDAFDLQEMEVPKPGPGQICIKVSAFGLNYADIMARQGLYRGAPPLPFVMGYDVEGEIFEVGSGVTEFKTGDKVFALTRFGGYAEYAIANAMAVGHLDNNAPLGIGCALSVHGVTAYQAAMHVQTLMPGEKVVIHAAAGGLGTCLIQIALWKKCIVIALVGNEEKEKYVRNLGVQHVVNHQKNDYIEYVQNHFGGKVDVVFDNVGGSSIKKAKSILAPGGRIVSLGAAALSGKHGKLNLIKLGIGFGWFSPIPFLGKSQAFIGVNMLKLADHRPDMVGYGFKEVQKLYEVKVLQPHVGKIFPHTELAQAHAYMQDRKAMGKIVVKWTT